MSVQQPDGLPSYIVFNDLQSKLLAYESKLQEILAELKKDDVPCSAELGKTKNQWLDSKSFVIFYFDIEVFDPKKAKSANLEAVKASIVANQDESVVECSFGTIDMDRTQLISLKDQSAMESLASRTIETVVSESTVKLSFIDAEEAAAPVEPEDEPLPERRTPVKHDPKIQEKLAKQDKNIVVLMQQEEVFTSSAKTLQKNTSDAAEAFKDISNELASVFDRIQLVQGFVQSVYSARVPNSLPNTAELYNILERLELYVDAQNRIRSIPNVHMVDPTNKQKHLMILQNMFLKKSKNNIGGMPLDAMEFVEYRMKALSTRDLLAVWLRSFYGAILKMKDILSFNIFGNDIFVIREKTPERLFTCPLPTMLENSYRKYVMEF